MRKIEPVTYRRGSETKTGSLLDARIINDDLSSSCVFYWEVKNEVAPPSDSEDQSLIPGERLDEGNLWEVKNEVAPPSDSEDQSLIPGERLDEGNLTMIKEEYELWDGSNDAAYNFIATSLNLILIPETNPIV